MPSRAEIVSFAYPAAPPGTDSWVPGAAPASGIEVTDPDPAWPGQYDQLAERIRQALGWRVLQLEHVGSTAGGHVVRDHQKYAERVWTLPPLNRWPLPTDPRRR